MHVTLGGRNDREMYFEDLLYTKSFFPEVHHFVRVVVAWEQREYLVVLRDGEGGLGTRGVHEQPEGSCHETEAGTRH